MGLAVLATLSTTRSNNLLAGGYSTASALTSGYHLAFIIGAGALATAIGVALTVLRPADSTEHAAVEELAREEAAYSEAA